jgi:hypothetical protein
LCRWSVDTIGFGCKGERGGLFGERFGSKDFVDVW